MQEEVGSGRSSLRLRLRRNMPAKTRRQTGLSGPVPIRLVVETAVPRSQAAVGQPGSHGMGTAAICNRLRAGPIGAGWAAEDRVSLVLDGEARLLSNSAVLFIKGVLLL